MVDKYQKIKDSHQKWAHYLIHDNYGHPFCVYISPNNIVDIYKRPKKGTNDTEQDRDILEYYTVLVGQYKAEEVFIGKSPKNVMTKFSGGFGPRFDGNTILLKLNKYSYISITSKIIMFKTEHEIIKYVSPVGNNDVPYPYAIDTQKNYYLITESVIFKSKEKIAKKYKDDPYDYYYQVLSVGIIYFYGVSKFTINGEEFTLTTTPNPEADYKDLVSRFGSKMNIKYIDGRKDTLDKRKYVKLLKDYNAHIGLNKINQVKIIHKRI